MLMYHSELIHHVENFLKKVLGGNKSQIFFLLEPKSGVCRQNGGRLGDVTEAGRPVLRGLEVILQILRLGGHFCASAPPPSLNKGFFSVKI